MAETGATVLADEAARRRQSSSGPLESPPGPARASRPGRPAEGQVRDLASLLDRPLTSYYLVLGATALLLGLGLVMVLSASSVTSYRDSRSSFAIFQKQALWLAVGLPLLWLAARLSVRAYRRLAYPALLAALGALALVPIFGVEVNGNTNWLDFGGPFRIQPSEPAKLALIVWGADLLARKVRLLDQWKHLLVPLVPLGGMLIGLVLLGDDLGTSLVLMAVLLALLFFAGAPLRLFVAGFVLLGTLVAYLASTQQHRMGRIASWWEPGAAADAVWGYQALHGKYALASGGWWGLGLGASREKWGALPHAHNDFIFAIIGEELGLIGTLAVLALFGTLGYAGIRIAARSADPFVRLAAMGVTTWVLVQTLINVGAVLGVLPVIGIPLPLVSYGGSALLVNMLAMGMLMAFARREPRAARALAARKARPLRLSQRLAHLSKGPRARGRAAGRPALRRPGNPNGGEGPSRRAGRR